jgi:hypothetical protein
MPEWDDLYNAANERQNQRTRSDEAEEDKQKQLEEQKKADALYRTVAKFLPNVVNRAKELPVRCDQAGPYAEFQTDGKTFRIRHRVGVGKGPFNQLVLFRVDGGKEIEVGATDLPNRPNMIFPPDAQTIEDTFLLALKRAVT